MTSLLLPHGVQTNLETTTTTTKATTTATRPRLEQLTLSRFVVARTHLAADALREGGGGERPHVVRSHRKERPLRQTVPHGQVRRNTYALYVCMYISPLLHIFIVLVCRYRFCCCFFFSVALACRALYVDVRMSVHAQSVV